MNSSDAHSRSDDDYLGVQLGQIESAAGESATKLEKDNEEAPIPPYVKSERHISFRFGIFITALNFSAWAVAFWIEFAIVFLDGESSRTGVQWLYLVGALAFSLVFVLLVVLLSFWYRWNVPILSCWWKFNEKFGLWPKDGDSLG